MREHMHVKDKIKRANKFCQGTEERDTGPE